LMRVFTARFTSRSSFSRFRPSRLPCNWGELSVENSEWQKVVTGEQWLVKSCQLREVIGGECWMWPLLLAAGFVCIRIRRTLCKVAQTNHSYHRLLEPGSTHQDGEIGSLYRNI
jgi:hypothetical protein